MDCPGRMKSMPGPIVKTQADFDYVAKRMAALLLEDLREQGYRKFHVFPLAPSKGVEFEAVIDGVRILGQYFVGTPDRPAGIVTRADTFALK